MTDLEAGAATLRVAGEARIAAAAIALFCASATTAQAQTGDGAVHLPPVVVSATRSAESVSTIPASVTVIEREEIERQQKASKSLGDLLGKLVPGLAPSSQTMTNSGQTLRGRNVLVLIDGVPQNTTRNVSRDFFTIDPSAIERIEVVRGATAMYGNGSAGGVVNIITRRAGGDGIHATTELGMRTALSHLSEDGLGGELRQTFSGGSEKIDYMLSANLKNTGGFYDAEGDRIPLEPSQGDLSDSLSGDILGKVGVNFDAQRLQLTMNHFRSQQDTNYASDPAVTAFPQRSVKARAIEGLVLNDQPETENTVLNLDYSHEDVFGSLLQGQLYYRDYFTRFFPFDGRALTAWNNVAQTYLDSETLGGRLSLETPFSALKEDDVTLTFGVDHSRETTEQPATIYDPTTFDQSGGLVFRKIGDRLFVPPITHSSTGVFGQGEWALGEGWTLRAGARHERISAEVDDFTTLGQGNQISGGSVDYSDTVYNAGAVYAVTQEIDLYGNFSQGFSLPDIGLALRGAAPGFSISSAALKPIKVDNYELGVRGNWDRVQSSLAAFYSTSDLGVSSNGFTSTMVRAPERIYGMEATLDLELGQQWRTGGSLTWSEGENEVNGRDVALNSYRIAPYKVTSYLEYEPVRGWRNRLQMLASGSRDEAADDGVSYGGQKVEGYVVFDLISQFDVGPGTLNVGIENLFNNQYFTTQSQLLPSGNNTSYLAAQGTVMGVSYTMDW